MDPKGQEEETVVTEAGRDLYRALLRCSSDGILLLERETGRIAEANAAAGLMTRLAEESLVGRNFIDIVEPQDVSRVDAALSMASRNGSASADFSLAREAGGGNRPVAAHLEIVGKSGLLVILHDITQKARLIEMVRREKEMTRSLFETVNAFVMSTDLKGRIKVLNHKFREALHVNHSGVLGRSAVEELIAPQDRQAARKALESVLSRGIVEEVDLTVRLGETERVLSFNGALIRNREDGDSSGIIWVAIDVTAARRLMEDVRRREERTQRNLHQLKEFSRVSSAILQEPDLDRVCKMFVEAIRDVSNFNRAILTLCDEEFRGYQWYFAGLGEQEIARFHENKLTSRERVTIFQERFRLGNSYYIPHEEGWYYEGVRSRRDSGAMIDWHPDDFLFIPLFGSNRRIVGIVSVDDPIDGRRPTAESISPLELFAHQVAHAIEEKKLDQQVQRTNQRYRTLVETMNNGLFTVDLSERITFLNPALLKLTGYEESELIGQPITMLMSQEAAIEFRNRTRIRGNGGLKFEIDLKAGDGSTIPVQISATPYRQSQNERGSFAIVSDLREQKKAEAERLRMHEEVVDANVKLRESMGQLERAQEQLIQAEKLSALGELVSGVAHELNNPLTGVMGFGQLLMYENLSESAMKNVQRINQEAIRCQKIVQNLLTFARRHRPQRTLVDINEVVSTTIDLRAYQLRVDNIELETDLGVGLPPVLGDTHQLQQVFINIVNNAHHAMMSVDRPGRLLVRTRRDGDQVRVEFIDNGPGIPHDKIGRIFDPFFTTKEIGRGTGLGLSLSYGIVSGHDGQILVSSEPGEGACFTVELPARPAESIPEQIAKEEPTVRPEASPHGRILIVDDETTIVELLRTLLEGSGHTVETANDGRQAIAMVRDGDYDLIISDVKMPDIGGQKLYETIREIKPELLPRMIFSTGDTANPATQAFFSETGNPYIAKPFKLEEVDALVAKVLLGDQ